MWWGYDAIVGGHNFLACVVFCTRGTVSAARSRFALLNPRVIRVAATPINIQFAVHWRLVSAGTLGSSAVAVYVIAHVRMSPIAWAV